MNTTNNKKPEKLKDYRSALIEAIMKIEGDSIKNDYSVDDWISFSKRSVDELNNQLEYIKESYSMNTDDNSKNIVSYITSIQKSKEIYDNLAEKSNDMIKKG